MLPAPSQEWTASDVAWLTVFIIGLITLCYFYPPLAFALTGYAMLSLVVGIVTNRRLKKLAATRPHDSICTFARSFDRRHVDPWVIRAVWEELQSYFPAKDKDFPLRASDHFEDRYGIDAEELYDIISPTVATRAGRELAGMYSNSVETIGDFVLAMNAQPRTPTQT